MLRAQNSHKKGFPVLIPGQEDHLEEEMALHSSMLAW